MQSNRYKVFILIVISIFLSCPISMASDQVKWDVNIGMYSGMKDPTYQLDNDEVNNLKKLINTEMKEASRIAADDKEKHQGRLKEYQQYHNPKSSYKGILVRARDNSNELIEAYNISGKYIRVYSEDRQSSKLFKMKNNKIEEYLIQLANEKGATHEVEKNQLEREINERDNPGLPYKYKANK